MNWFFVVVCFLDFIYLFLERGREGEREGEKQQGVVASSTPPTGDLVHNPGMCLTCLLYTSDAADDCWSV